VAAVEFAIVAPVLMALTIGTIDLCSMLFLKETAVLAAYEGARIGVPRDRTNDMVRQRVMQFLDERGVQYTGPDVVTFSSPGFDSAETLQHVTVNVQIPAEGNLLIASQVFGDLMINASVTMRKEYKNLDAP
jgi:Flp pilus assembly protein TadG